MKPRAGGRAAPRRVAAAVLGVALLATTGCSIRQLAIKQLGSALAEGTGGAFAAEPDVEFAGQAVPFSLKLIESLLLEQPDNAELLVAAASGFTQYSYVWVQQPADFIEDEDFARAQAGRERARAFYVRAHDYAVRALAGGDPGFVVRLAVEPVATAAAFGRGDVPALYWAAASLGGALALSKTDPEMVARQPVLEALIDRAFALDPEWNGGVLRELLMAYELARPGGGPAALDRARGHFAVLTAADRPPRASPLVGYAETVCVQEQDRAEFTRLLERALAINTDLTPTERLANVVMQRRARWLLDRVDELFLD